MQEYDGRSLPAEISVRKVHDNDGFGQLFAGVASTSSKAGRLLYGRAKRAETTAVTSTDPDSVSLLRTLSVEPSLTESLLVLLSAMEFDWFSQRVQDEALDTSKLFNRPATCTRSGKSVTFQVSLILDS